ncbi:hypothetical protein LTR66_015696 [Elasticomyces elasticus]|nr:hypothetical protein LTR66_015696 [Elasticomyces elasticus]
MVQVKGHDIEVLVRGKTLREFHPAESRHKIVMLDVVECSHDMRYIRVADGQYFCVRIRISERALWPLSSKRFTVYLDGEYATNDIVGHKQWQKAMQNGEGDYILDSATTETDGEGNCLKRRFMFGNVHTNEDSVTVTEINARYRELGGIQVDVHDVEGRPTRLKDQSAAPSTKEEVPTVPEKATKNGLLDVKAGFGIGKICKVSNVHFRTTEENYVTSVVFKYRSEKALQSLELLPAPVSLENRDPGTLTKKQLLKLMEIKERRMAEEVEERINERMQVKSEEAVGVTGRGIKREHEGEIEDDECQVMSSKKVKIGSTVEEAVEIEDD